MFRYVDQFHRVSINLKIVKKGNMIEMLKELFYNI